MPSYLDDFNHPPGLETCNLINQVLVPVCGRAGLFNLTTGLKNGKKKITQRNLLSLPFFKMMNAFLRQIHHWSLEGGNVKKSYGLLAFTS